MGVGVENLDFGKSRFWDAARAKGVIKQVELS